MHSVLINFKTQYDELEVSILDTRLFRGNLFFTVTQLIEKIHRTRTNDDIRTNPTASTASLYKSTASRCNQYLQQEKELRIIERFNRIFVKIYVSIKFGFFEKREILLAHVSLK